MLPRTCAVWEYAGEILASALIYLALVLSLGANKVSGWVFAKHGELSVAVGIAVAIGIAIFAAFIAVLCTDFGKQLRLKGEAQPYIVGFGTPILIFLLTLLSLIFITQQTDGWCVRIVSMLLIYSCLNCYTAITNMIGLVSLWQEVDRARHYGKP
jgi:hypothetical protein